MAAGQEPVEVYENDIDLNLKAFCDENGIEDMRKESQSVWNACMIYIQRHLFVNRDMLKRKHNIANGNAIMDSTYNSYDYNLVNDICDYYIYMCYRYEKECSIYGFSKLTNIPYQVIENWGGNYDKSNRLSKQSQEIHKKLVDEREQSLLAKLISMKHPTAIAIPLNKIFGYNLPGVSRERASNRALTAAELPKLGGVVVDQGPENVQNSALENGKINI